MVSVPCTCRRFPSTSMTQHVDFGCAPLKTTVFCSSILFHSPKRMYRSMPRNASTAASFDVSTMSPAVDVDSVIVSSRESRATATSLEFFRRQVVLRCALLWLDHAKRVTMRLSHCKLSAELWNLMLFSGGAELIDKGNADRCRQKVLPLGRTQLGNVS